MVVIGCTRLSLAQELKIAPLGPHPVVSLSRKWSSYEVVYIVRGVLGLMPAGQLWRVQIALLFSSMEHRGPFTTGHSRNGKRNCTCVDHD